MQHTYLYERAGVTLHVEYAVDPDGVLNFKRIRVADADYQPCGPDLCDFLNPMVLMATPQEGEHFLSVLVGEIQHDRH